MLLVLAFPSKCASYSHIIHPNTLPYAVGRAVCSVSFSQPGLFCRLGKSCGWQPPLLLLQWQPGLYSSPCLLPENRAACLERASPPPPRAAAVGLAGTGRAQPDHGAPRQRVSTALPYAQIPKGDVGEGFAGEAECVLIICRCWAIRSTRRVLTPVHKSPQPAPEVIEERGSWL